MTPQNLPVLGPRPIDSHKGMFGRILIVAGSRGMSGAAVLATSAALRGGAGLVRTAVPSEILPLVAIGNPCAMTLPLAQDDQGRIHATALPTLLAQARASDVLVLGPGLGHTEDIGDLITEILVQTTIPLVLDADALNVLRGRMEPLRRRSVPAILTPHPGEFSRLTGVPTPTDPMGREAAARAFAQEYGVVLVLKGHGTVVSDGTRTVVNGTGNPGMATGGSGDVLAGLIGALLGQKLAPFEAAHLGVYLHGRAGDLACAEFGEVSLLASDLVTALPRAFCELRP